MVIGLAATAMTAKESVIRVLGMEEAEMGENRLEFQVWRGCRWERLNGRAPIMKGCRLPVVFRV